MSTKGFKFIQSSYEKELINFFKLCEDYYQFVDDYRMISKANGFNGGIILVLMENIKQFQEKFNACKKTLISYKETYGLYHEDDFSRLDDCSKFLNELEEWFAYEVKKIKVISYS